MRARIGGWILRGGRRARVFVRALNCGSESPREQQQCHRERGRSKRPQRHAQIFAGGPRFAVKATHGIQRLEQRIDAQIRHTRRRREERGVESAHQAQGGIRLDAEKDFQQVRRTENGNGDVEEDEDAEQAERGERRVARARRPARLSPTATRQRGE